MKIIELISLKKQFGELVAVNNIDMSVEKGEIRGLIGPNGSGKTTLFNLVTGFIKPTEGKVFLEGQDISGFSTDLIAKKGLVRTFQHTVLFKEMTVLKNMLIASHLHTGMGLFEQFLQTPKNLGKEKEVEKRSLAKLEIVELAEKKDELAGALPHGSQKALGIAIALAAEPKLLLLDEPVAGMNPSETNKIMKSIKKLRKDGITILLVEHDMKAVMSTCDRITVMSFGEKIAEGKPEEISRNEDVIEAYLGKGLRV
ncbi:MAG TPA: ABC transporter ATP-binding protein [Spirochaetes bacterium]|nr:ABC transporter ATP-binding protein [Spirochaetota bacterium]